MQKSKTQAYQVASSVMNLVLLVFTVFSIIIFVFARPFNQLITSTQFSPTQLQLAVNLSRIMIFAQILFAISNFLTSTIQAQKRFLIPALSPIAYNLGIIISIILLAPTLGIYSAAFGVLLGAFLHLLLQIPLSFKLGFVYKPIIKLRHPGVKEMFRLMPPRVLSISVTQIELSVMVFFATALTAGSLTILQIAQQLIIAPIRMFSVPIGQASLPFLSKESNQKSLDKFKSTFQNSFHQILYLAIPAATLLIILRIPLVRIVYGTRQFPWTTTLLTGKTVAILSLSLFAQASIHILTRAFYALHNTRKPFVIALISVATNIVLSILAVFKLNLGVLGLAASLSIASILQAILLLISLSKTISGFRVSSLLTPPAKMFFASVIMGLFLWVPMRLLDQFVFDTTRTLNLIVLTLITSLIGMAVYLTISKILKINQLQDFTALLSRIGNWRKVLSQTQEVIEPASQAQEVKPTQ